VNESTGGRHPSHSESDPAVVPRLYRRRLVPFQARIEGVTRVPMRYRAVATGDPCFAIGLGSSELSRIFTEG